MLIFIAINIATPVLLVVFMIMIMISIDIDRDNKKYIKLNMYLRNIIAHAHTLRLINCNAITLRIYTN
jgi:hypothetical protein